MISDARQIVTTIERQESGNMTLDEAIAQEREEVKRLRKIIETGYDGEIRIAEVFCDDTESINEKYQIIEKCAKEHEQLAKWLEELKNYRDKNKLVVRIDVVNIESVEKKIIELEKLSKCNYDKAIDDFVKYIDECSGWTPKCIEHDISLTVYTLHQIAEQLKEG